MAGLRWGILGASSFAKAHMGPAIARAPGGDLVALATSSPDKAAGFRDFAPGLRVHDRYEALLADPALDAVYIPLPNHLHVEWSLKAAAAGKHVLCEKPMAMRAEEFDALIAARDRSGRLVAEAYMILFHPQWTRVRDIVRNGELGRLGRIDVAFSFDNRDGANIRNRPETGGGGLRDIGVYTFGSVRFATGLEPDEVAARIEWENGVDIHARVSARFGTADYAAFTSIRLHPRQEVVFQGDLAMLRVPVPFNARVAGEARIELTTGHRTVVERWPDDDQYVHQVAAFNRAARDGTPYGCPLEFSRGTQAMIDAAFAAAGPAPV